MPGYYHSVPSGQITGPHRFVRWENSYNVTSVKGVKPVRRKTAKQTKDAPKSIDEYLAGVPEPARSTLNKIRATIRSAVPPEATEVISYRIPAFKYKGMLVWFGAFSDHCSLFPGPGIMEAFKDELKRYPIAKGTIQFPLDKPLPATLLKRIVKARVAANEKKKSQ
ncbi:MAG: DUF1801 domain-containing protein [Verrucomicrobia bacterium]|nr:DUF1801 domain-containing protein [Verrucomicrobiota bacterium]MBV8276883.1 DUF1801 domain-containing protein [Verrucomicrobiota bacterium]